MKFFFGFCAILTWNSRFFVDGCCNPFDEIHKYVEKIKKGNAELRQENVDYRPLPDHIDSNWSKINASRAAIDPIEYDFIIVGGGASGSVLANRLSEIPEWKILLLEAGGEGNIITEIPSNTLLLQRTHYNWGYRTTPQKHWCLENPDRRCVIEAGKVLGGSTVINGMMVTRGNKEDYAIWGQMVNDAYCWNSVFPYFLKMEDARIRYYDRKYHRKGGLLTVETPRYFSPVGDILVDSSLELNVPFIDHNGKTDKGFDLTQGTTRNGKRLSAADAYIKPARERPNLTVKTHSYVTKILIDPHTKEAYAVQYLEQGKLTVTKATKEVILSAGGIGSPKLLLLSGVGPKSDLEQLHIDPICDLPVGKQMKDHLGFQGIKYIFEDIKLPPRNEDEDIYEYLKEHKGPLTGYNIEGISFRDNPDPKLHDDYDRPDFEFFFIANVENNTQTVNILVTTMHPKSVGSLKLSSSDPIQSPLVDLNHLSDEHDHDIETTLAGVRAALKYGNTKTFKSHGARLDTTKPPGCETLDYGSDAYWKCAIRRQSISFRHYISTNKMGPSDDPDAVVNDRMQVYGVEKLRVIDNSVIPVTITGHMMLPAYLMGEMGADFIKNRWLS